MAKKPARQNRRQATATQPGQSNQVRIVGGAHRGRKLRFADGPGLRPTADRVRETLFNWLQPHLAGARCLDLFAGSGVLGLEAVSRGAGEVVQVDVSREVVVQLQANGRLLGVDNLQVEQADALRWLAQPATAFDIVFLDPPFADALLSTACSELEQGGWLAPEARIYLEWDRNGPAPQVPEQWRCLREKQAGQVAYALYTR